MIGHTKMVDTILRFMGEDTRYEIENYVKETAKEKYLQIQSEEELKKIFKNNISNFLDNVTQDELLDLRTYTGYNFKFINAILRRNWNYEENGLLTEDKKRELMILAENISSIINKFAPLSYNFTTYRGTTLSSFSKYGIYSIKDLESLKGNYLYEEGFTSTSIIEDTCYFNKCLDTGLNYNVKIEYLITPECEEGALLINNDMTYSLKQNEYLINKGSLSKVIDVKIDENLNQAILTVTLIPKKKWNKVQGINDKVR